MILALLSLNLLMGPFGSSTLTVPAITQKSLDELIVYEVPVTENLGNTTILFPSPISGIFASKAAPTVQPNADFLIDYQQGSYYFTVRALKPNVQDYINVVFDRKVYVFHIFASKHPYRKLTLFHALRNSPGKEAAISPERLIALLDKVKSYSVLAAQHPAAVDGVMHDTPKKVFEYDGYRLVIQDVYRFEEADTLIFSVTLENKTSQHITYDPQNVSIGLKDNLYSTSIVDASGDIPPNATVVAYFGITGTATGGRNNLRPKNDWDIILLSQNENASSCSSSNSSNRDKNPMHGSGRNLSSKNSLKKSH